MRGRIPSFWAAAGAALLLAGCFTAQIHPTVRERNISLQPGDLEAHGISCITPSAAPGQEEEKQAVALVFAVGVAAASLWEFGSACGVSPSTSQIFIHGTPVCVTQRGAEIRATVGACGALPGGMEGDGSYRHRGRSPVPGNPRLELPPGHPPIGPDDGPLGERNRRVLI